VLSSLLFFSLTSWCICQCIQLFYQSNIKMQNYWEFFWNHLLPVDVGNTLKLIAVMPLLSTGITFLSGCLLIIAWSKDKPCPNWNPFSARELSMSNRAIFACFGSMIALCYCLSIGAYRSAFLTFAFLCSANVAIAFFCHHLQSDKYITEQLVKYILTSNIQNRIRNSIYLLESNMDWLH